MLLLFLLLLLLLLMLWWWWRSDGGRGHRCCRRRLCRCLGSSFCHNTLGCGAVRFLVRVIIVEVVAFAVVFVVLMLVMAVGSCRCGDMVVVVIVSSSSSFLLAVAAVAGAHAVLAARPVLQSFCCMSHFDLRLDLLHESKRMEVFKQYEKEPFSKGFGSSGRLVVASKCPKELLNLAPNRNLAPGLHRVLRAVLL